MSVALKSQALLQIYVASGDVLLKSSIHVVSLVEILSTRRDGLSALSDMLQACTFHVIHRARLLARVFLPMSVTRHSDDWVHSGCIFEDTTNAFPCDVHPFHRRHGVYVPVQCSRCTPTRASPPVSCVSSSLSKVMRIGGQPQGALHEKGVPVVRVHFLAKQAALARAQGWSKF